ncbi:type II secretion system protein [PVC group bacterium]|nr:type II secretion system protein [PVC group bacterium]
MPPPPIEEIEKRPGMLLLEVIVAMVVLSVGLTMMMRSFSISIKAARVVQNYFYAVVRVENLVWDLEENYVSLQGEGKRSDMYGEYQTAVDSFDLSPQALKKSTVEVYWQEGKRREGVKFISLFYVPPPRELEL